jgi:hypothetical protein
MTGHDPRPILGLSGVEAGAILGVTQLTVSQLVANGVLPKAVRYQHCGRGPVGGRPFAGRATNDCRDATSVRYLPFAPVRRYIGALSQGRHSKQLGGARRCWSDIR